MRIKDFRREAREALSGNWFVAIVASFIYALFSGSGFTIEAENTNDITTQLASSTNSWDALIPLILTSLGAAVLCMILSGLVTVGYAQFNIDLIDGERPRIGTLFSKLRQAFKAIIASFLVTLRAFFGLILLIIPGIVSAYSHAMVNFILAENPDMTVREAMAESRSIMKGNKFRLFRLHLSFFGWWLLVIITLGIAAIWVVPYENAATAAFYREIA